MIEQKIIERIQKLLALSGNNTNENEAASALAKAQALLQEYNLEMAEVQKRTGKKSSYERLQFASESRDEWRRQLMGIVAKHCFCKALFYRLRDKNETVLIGEKQNIEATRMMYAFIERQLLFLAEKGLEQYKRRISSATHGRMWKMNFFDGAVAIIRERLEEEQRHFEARANECTSLIVLKDKELATAIKTFYPKVGKHTYSHRASNSDGYAEGQQAGKNVQLRQHKQIER